MGRQLGLVLGAAILFARPCSAAEPRWPLDLPAVLTSSFGEFRSGRLHAGIDLATGGQSGAACHATGDGTVVRMRMGPFGYGKALYIQMDGGPLVVYAHLSRFAEPMAARARVEQKRHGRYSFDIELPAGEIRVQRDAVVAWSGQTGVGVPHLHFELRDGDVARNPQTAGFAAPDTIAPVVGEIAVTPMDVDSHVAGGLETRALPASGAPLVVGGRVGFSVRAWDHATSRAYRQAPYRYELRVDGITLYRLVHERFDYDTNHLVALEYDAERLVERDERAQLLYLRPGDRVSGREAPNGHQGWLVTAGHVARSGSRGWLARATGLDPEPGSFAPGLHDVEVEVADAAGHVTRRRVQVVTSAIPSAGIEARFDSARVSWTAWGRDADLGRDDELTARFAVSRDGGARWDSLPGALDAEPGRPAAAVDRRQWHGELAWEGHSPIVLRARLRDRAGLEAVATWSNAGMDSTRPGVPFAVRPVWRPRWVELDIQPRHSFGWNVPRVVWSEDGHEVAVRLQTLGPRRYRACVPLAALQSDLALAGGAAGSSPGAPIALRSRFLRAGAAARVADLDSALVVEVPAGALLEDVALRAERVAPGKLGPELRAAGPCLAVEPRTVALDQPVKIALRPAARRGASQPVGLFWVNRSGDLRFLSADRDAGGWLVAETRNLSRFVALADTTPPHIGPLQVQGRGKQPQRLLFTTYDEGAGLGDGGITTEVDAAVAIPEWDPETGEVLVELERRLAPGAHQLRVTVRDQLGNRRARVLKFTVP